MVRIAGPCSSANVALILVGLMTFWSVVCGGGGGGLF